MRPPDQAEKGGANQAAGEEGVGKPGEPGCQYVPVADGWMPVGCQLFRSALERWYARCQVSRHDGLLRKPISGCLPACLFVCLCLEAALNRSEHLADPASFEERKGHRAMSFLSRHGLG